MNPHGITLEKVIPLSLEQAEEAAAVKDDVDMDLFPFFEEEAKDELTAIESVLHGWERDNAAASLKGLCRQFHTLKGAANSIGHVRIGALAGGMKDVLEELAAERAFASRFQIIKTCIFVIGTIRSLLQETRSPQFNPAKTEQIVTAIQSIWRLREMQEGLKGKA